MKINFEKITDIFLKCVFFILIFGFIALIFLLIYFSFFEEKNSIPEVVDSSNLTHSIQIYIDPKTNCEYFIFDGYNKGNMIPRLNKDGKIICEKDNTQ